MLSLGLLVLAVLPVREFVALLASVTQLHVQSHNLVTKRLTHLCVSLIRILAMR